MSGAAGTDWFPRWVAVGGWVVLLAAAAVVMAFGRAGREALPDVVALHVPAGMEARSTLLLLTGAEGWTAEHAARAERLAGMHTLVIGVDGPGLLRRVGGDCAATGAPLADLAREVQQAEGALARSPVLGALPGAGDLALRAALAAPARFKGLVTEGVGTRPGLCGGRALPPGMGGKAPVRWLDLRTDAVASPAAGLAGTKIVAPGPDPRRAFYRSYLSVAGTDSSFDINTGGGVEGLADLPLTIHVRPDAPVTDAYAIFLSGDGGWARFDEEIADRLAARGVPVIGISTLRYLWQEKPPATIARDLARIDAHYSAALGRRRVLLLGFSLGANSLPFAAAELSEAMRARVAGIGLISPEVRTGFEIVFGGWLGHETGAIEVAPAIGVLEQALPGTPVLCLFGRKETASACPLADLPGLRSIGFEGGHHLGHDHDRIVGLILELLHPVAGATPAAEEG